MNIDVGVGADTSNDVDTADGVELGPGLGGLSIEVETCQATAIPIVLEVSVGLVGAGNDVAADVGSEGRSVATGRMALFGVGIRDSIATRARTHVISASVSSFSVGVVTFVAVVVVIVVAIVSGAIPKSD